MPATTNSNLTFKLNTNEKSEIELLSNVPYLYDIQQEFKKFLEAGTKEELAKVYGSKIFDLIKKPGRYNINLAHNPNSKQNKPFFVVPYHANSDFEDQRSEELKNINALIKVLNKYLVNQYKLEVTDFVVMGDFNDNALKETKTPDGKTKAIIDKPLLKKSLENLVNGAEVIRVALPKGIMHKQRGVPGRPYNLYNNPQAEKNLLDVEDGKNRIVVGRLNSLIKNPSEAVDTYLNDLEKDPDQQQFEINDLLVNSPFYRDHLASHAIRFNDVVLAIDSYLPTEGVKAIKEPKDFKEDVTKLTPEQLNSLRTTQEKSTELLFNLMATAFQTTFNPEDLKSNAGTKAILRNFKTAQEQNCPLTDIAKATAVLKTILDSWQQSEQYKAALNLIKDDKHSGIQKKMGEAADKIIKAYQDAEKAGKKFDLVTKIIQICGQNQGQEFTGGYASLNNDAYPGPKKVDDAHIASTLNMITDKNQSVIICNTESGKNKSAYFHTNLAKGIAGFHIPHWNAELSEYLNQRAKKYAAKDALFPADKEARVKSINLLIENLKELAQVKVMPADSSLEFVKDEDTVKWIKKCDEIIKNISTMKKLFPGQELTKCLNKISYQIQTHRDAYSYRPEKSTQLPKEFFTPDFANKEALELKDKLNAQKDSLGKEKNTELATFINQVLNCYSKIELFDLYQKDFKAATQTKDNLVRDMKVSLNRFVKAHLDADSKFKMPSKDELNQFSWEFMATAHHQDDSMNSRRSSWLLVADILIGVLTLGILHATKALVQKVSTGTCTFSLFNHNTTRMNKIKDTEQEVAAMSVPVGA